MKSQRAAPFMAGHVILPLLRPLPFLFSYASHVSRDSTLLDRMPELEDEFTAQLDGFKALVDKASDLAGLNSNDSRDVVSCVNQLAISKPNDLVRDLDRLDLELAHFSSVNKDVLRRAYHSCPEVFRDVCTRYLNMTNLLLVYQSGSSEGVPKLEELLAERCYFTVKVAEETYSISSIRKSDVVVFAPSEQPISSSTFQKIKDQKIPLLVLVNLGANLQGADMVQTRLAGLYRQNGIPIMYRPFPAVRLFQQIDHLTFKNRVRQETTPEVEKFERKEMIAVQV